MKYDPHTNAQLRFERTTERNDAIEDWGGDDGWLFSGCMIAAGLCLYFYAVYYLIVTLRWA